MIWTVGPCYAACMHSQMQIQSPLEEARKLSESLGSRVLLKREDLQPVFSFKLRGAYNKVRGAGLPGMRSRCMSLLHRDVLYMALSASSTRAHRWSVKDLPHTRKLDMCRQGKMVFGKLE